MQSIIRVHPYISAAKSQLQGRENLIYYIYPQHSWDSNYYSDSLQVPASHFMIKTGIANEGNKPAVISLISLSPLQA